MSDSGNRRVKIMNMSWISGIRSAAFVAGMVAAAALFVADVPEALADRECRETCSDSRHICKDAAKGAVRGCREHCREAESRRECRVACRGEFRTARVTCKAAIEECRDTCERPAPPSGGHGGPVPEQCIHECKGELRACSGSVLQAGRACSTACIDMRREGMAACRQADDRFRCFLDLVFEVGSCLRGCAHDMHGAGQACLGGFRQCREDCESGPYGSASQAFLNPVATLLD
jgi:hypothetical protein